MWPHVKSQGEVWYLNLCMQLISDNPLTTSRKMLRYDLETIKSRFQNEGLSFLSKTMPKLGKALDLGLVEGKFTPIYEFRSVKGRSTPAFMQEYFNLIFSQCGVLLDEPNVDAIKHLRQVLFVSYKLELPYSDTDKSAVVSKFVNVELEVQASSSDEHDADILQLCQIITGKVFKGFDPLDIIPRHGPGAVATGEKLDAKWTFARKYLAIHRVYPYYHYMVAGGARELIDRLDWYHSLEVHESGTAKVVLVPKDSRGPRLISCEPLEYMWLQQGLGRKLVAWLEDNYPTAGSINFTRQDINQHYALAASRSQRFSTLDLSDASDRVSLRTVNEVFNRLPRLVRCLEALRSTATTLPDGTVVPLSKFAPMGSALCFPIEAYIFWVLIVAAIIRQSHLPLEKVGKEVLVYGDDIIVPTEWAHLSIQTLESFGLKVNRSKSCITGYFRESCGVDAFKGTEVTPLRLKHQWTGRHTDGSAFSSYVSLGNRFSERGYTKTSQFIWEELEKVYGKIPYGLKTSSFPCRWAKSFTDAILLNNSIGIKKRFNVRLQRVEFFVLIPRNKRIKAKVESWPRLLRNFVSPPFGDPSSIVVPRSMRIKRGWAPPG